ncbi:hypothetical protein ABHZ32_12010 [Bacteroides uniformis]|uniref:hypothetical protein n=1 Tax=Bacteroides uniformis TaxID=820 RepID=UPI003218F746
MSSKTVKRQTFALDGGTYIYRITEASIRRYEEANAVPISAYMTMLQVVRALYHMTCMLPAGYNEQAFIDAYKKGTLYTRSSRGEYTLRGIRSLMVSARRELIGVAVAEPQQPVILHHRRRK